MPQLWSDAYEKANRLGVRFELTARRSIGQDPQVPRWDSNLRASSRIAGLGPFTTYRLSRGLSDAGSHPIAARAEHARPPDR